MAIIACKYRNYDNCEYEGMPVAALTCQECLQSCDWQCTIYTGADRVELRRSLLEGLHEKKQPVEAIRKTMRIYSNCADDEYDYCSACYETALIYLYKEHRAEISEEEAKAAEEIMQKISEEE